MCIRDRGETLRTRTAWEEAEEIGSSTLSGRLLIADSGSMVPQVLALEDALVLARSLEKVVAEMPPFPEIRDDVLAKWRERQQGELALKALESLRAQLAAAAEEAGSGEEEGSGDAGEPGGTDPTEESSSSEEAGDPEQTGDGEPEPGTGEETADDVEDPVDEGDGTEDSDEPEPEPVPVTVDAETFERIVTEAGYTLQRRERFEQNAPFEAIDVDDPDSRAEANNFMRNQRQIFELEEGGVTEPVLNNQRTRVYLYRLAGVQDPELSKMRPQDYETLRDQASQTARFAFLTDALLSRSELENLYGLQFVRPEAADSESDSEDADSESGS